MTKDENKPTYTAIDDFDPTPVMLEYGMTAKQAYFAEWYLLTLNAAKAARLAGYSEPYFVTGHRALNYANVRKYLESRYAERKATPSYIIDQLIAIADADISDYLTVDPQYAEEHNGVFKLVADGRVLDGVWIDLRKALTAGRTGAIKTIKKVKGETVIELFDRTRALELLGRHYRLFADVQVVSDKADGTADMLSDEMLAKIARNGLRSSASVDEPAGDVSSDESGDDDRSADS